jgi:hypothetical protein
MALAGVAHLRECGVFAFTGAVGRGASIVDLAGSFLRARLRDPCREDRRHEKCAEVRLHGGPTVHDPNRAPPRSHSSA